RPVRNRSACPPAPSAAASSPAPAPPAWSRVGPPRSRWPQPPSRAGLWPYLSDIPPPPPAAGRPLSRALPGRPVRRRWVRRSSGTIPRRIPEQRSPAPRSLSETDLASGKYARAGSGRGHDSRDRDSWHRDSGVGWLSATESDDVAQSFIGGRGGALFVHLLVLLPGLGVPDLQVVDRTDHHAVLGQVGVAAVVGRQRDPAL